MKRSSVFLLLEKRSPLILSFALAAVVMPASARAQTFEINGQPPAKQAQGKQPGPKASPASPTGSAQIGWGSSIEVGRMARAAEDALRRGNHAAAATYAKRAVEAAPQDGKLWFLYGYTARLAGRYRESLDAYRQGLQRFPGNADGLSGMALTYERMGNLEEAKKLLLQVLQANPNRVPDLMVAGELFLRSGNSDQGLSFLQRAESIKPSAHAEVMMAMAYLKLKQPARAKQLLDQAKARDPKNTDIFRAVANFYREGRQYKEAIETLKSAPKMKPDVLADLAFTYEMAGETKNAAATYAKVADLDPKQINFQLSAAAAYQRLSDADLTKKYMARAEKIDADHYRLHALKAVVARAENRSTDAIREYSLALQKMPEGAAEGALFPVQMRMNLAELYRGEGNEAAAKQQLALAEEAINKIDVTGPQKAEFLRVRASIRSGAQDFAGAETDLKEALQLDPKNINVQLQYANLMWQTKRGDQALKMYEAVLAGDRKNRYALEGLGYIARESNQVELAQKYFLEMARYYPDDFVPYLALGDMYTSLYKFTPALEFYEKAYKLAPTTAAVVANGANAAIEDRKFDLARTWAGRAKGAMLDDPRIMRERMRVMFHSGDFRQSAQLGYKVLEKLPKDRNASVYLAYDLYNLGRYDDVLNLTSRYELILPKEPNFPLLSGHVHKQGQLLSLALDDYTRAIDKDTKMAEAYVNRGYVLNDLQSSERAVDDFNTALKLSPNNGVAHLGIAFSSLQLKRSSNALTHVQLAETLLGESGATNLVRATAYRQQRVLDKAEQYYVKALKYSPDDLGLYMALADTQYYARKYELSIGTLSNALRLSPDDPFIYAHMANANARLHRRDETMRYVREAEKEGSDYSGVLLATGEALMYTGETEAAMERFTRAMQATDSNRVDARLAIARLFVRDLKFEDAKQQVALAFAESRIGEAQPVSADNFIEAANIFLGAHDFELARKYFEFARDAGAGEEATSIGLANTYLATGNARQAEAELAALGEPSGYLTNYDYMVTRGAIFRQRHDSTSALYAFSRARGLGGDDDLATRQEYDLASEVGKKIERLGMTTSSDVSLRGIFEDATIYMLDSQFAAANGGFVIEPRSSMEMLLSNRFRYERSGLPPLSMGVQVRTDRGEVSVPTEIQIVKRATMDTSFNAGITPTLSLGSNRITFDTGIQFTVRRDSVSPIAINQNLFRQFLYFSTSPFGNWLSVRGQAFHEAGPFGLRDLNSREVGANLEFTVARPWGRTGLIAGWSGRDLKFEPLIREFFSTNTYVGIERRFGRNLKLTALGNYIRSWRVQELQYATAQAMAPSFAFDYRPSPKWTFEGNFMLQRGMNLHTYDNIQSRILISYVKPFRSSSSDGFGVVPVEYPIRISFGIQQEQFMNFTGRGTSQIRPVVRVSLF
ncbi:MAG TPA: tetratricopeptide repeat protein [Terriglobales bacterium]|nr:tetratricopeptide repeat protein [Terriglobales bacterium]